MTDNTSDPFIEHLRQLAVSPSEASKRPFYRDSVASWLVACCDQDLALRTTMKDLYASYGLYCDAANIHALAVSSFGKELSRLGFLVIRGNKGSSRWGLGLKNPESIVAPEVIKKPEILCVMTTNDFLQTIIDYEEANKK
jgi:hypothetical protein